MKKREGSRTKFYLKFQRAFLLKVFSFKCLAKYLSIKVNYKEQSRYEIQRCNTFFSYELLQKIYNSAYVFSAFFL